MFQHIRPGTSVLQHVETRDKDGVRSEGGCETTLSVSCESEGEGTLCCDRIRRLCAGKMPRNVCCDPYKKHKKLISANLRKVTKDLAEKVCDDRVKEEDYLCVSCSINLSSNPTSLPKEDSPSLPSVPTSEDDEACLAESSASDPEVIRQKADQVLSLLDISPLVSKSKLTLLRANNFAELLAIKVLVYVHNIRVDVFFL